MYSFDITYYFDGDRGSPSFRKVAKEHIRELRHRGIVQINQVFELHHNLVHFRSNNDVPYLNNVCVVHPFFSTHPAAIDLLKRRHKVISCCEVADTTRISEEYVKRINNPHVKAIFLPSTFAVSSFVNSGVDAEKVYLLPHGLNEVYSKPTPKIIFNKKLEEIRKDNRIKILSFFLHSWFRKGMDVAFEALNRLAKKYDFLYVIKTVKHTHEPYNLSWKYPNVNIKVIDDWIGEEELVYLFDSCDVFLSPQRGGSFEIPPLEALSRGLPTVLTGWGCVLDYATKYKSAYLIRYTDYQKILHGGHVGVGVNPDVNHATSLIQYILDNLDYCKSIAEKETEKIRQEYRWSKTIDIMLDVLKVKYDES